jgi:hypothetical protein
MAKLPPRFNRVYEYTNRSMLQFADALCPYLKKLGCSGGAPGGSYENYVEVPISNAQILNMASVPIELLPALGANQYYDFKYYIEVPEGDYNAGTGSFYVGYALTLTVAIYDSSSLDAKGDPVLLSGNSTSCMDVNNARYIYSKGPLSQPIRFQVQGGTGPNLGKSNALAKIWYNIITLG